MAFAFVASVNTPGGAGGGTTGSIDTTGADLIVAVVACYTGSAFATFTDNKSNTYSALTIYDSGTQQKGRIFYLWAPTVGTGHTFTVGGGSTFSSVCVAAFSGSQTSSDPFDQESGFSDLSTTVQAGSITPSVANELVIAGRAFTTGGDLATINGGFTLAESADASGSNYGSQLAYLVQTSAAAANPTWTTVSLHFTTAVIASFKSAAVATGNPWYAYAQMRQQ